ncbi:unnamed protein product [Mortierella alpina]
MADIFPPSLAFAGFCRKVKRTISLDQRECASKQLSKHTKCRSSKKRSHSSHAPVTVSSRDSSDTPPKSSAHASTSCSKAPRSSPRSPPVVGSNGELPAPRGSSDQNSDNGPIDIALTSNSDRVSVATTSSLLSSASRRRRSSATSSSTPSVEGTTMITTTTSTTSTKPILFINNVAPVVPRPKPSATVYVQSQSALQQKVRKQLRERGKIKRSSNCFIKYRTYMHPLIVAKYGNQNNKEISKLAGRSWRNEPEHVKAIYRQQASEEKQRHDSLFPSYVYMPAKHNHSKDSSTSARDCLSVARSLSSTSAIPTRSGPHTHNHTSDSRVEPESSHESVKRGKSSRKTQSSSSATGRTASERPQSTERPFVVTETPLHDFNGDSDLATHKRTSFKNKRQKGDIDNGLNLLGSVVSTGTIIFNTAAIATPTVRSGPPNFVEPPCQPISATVVPVICATDLPSTQSTGLEAAWMAVDHAQTFPSMSERPEVWGSLFPPAMGYSLSSTGCMVATDQPSILSTRPISIPSYPPQARLQHNSTTLPVLTIEQTFSFPLNESSVSTKPLLDNSFHQTFSWDLSGATPGSLNPPTYDHSSTSVDAPAHLYSSQIVPTATAVAAAASSQDFAGPGDSITGDFAHCSWLSDTSHTKEWPPSVYHASPMAIPASHDARSPSSSTSSPEYSSLLSPSPDDGCYGITAVSRSMAPPLLPTYAGLFDFIVPKSAPLSERPLPGTASGLGDPITEDFFATEPMAKTTISNDYSSRGNGGLCYFNSSNSSSSNHGSNHNGNLEGPRSIFQQPPYEHGGMYGCSDDELQRSIEFYERVLEQQKLQLSMRQIRATNTATAAATTFSIWHP